MEKGNEEVRELFKAYWEEYKGDERAGNVCISRERRRKKEENEI